MRSHHKVSKLEKKVKDIVLKTQTKIEEHKFLDNYTSFSMTLGSTGYIPNAGVLPTSASTIISLCGIGQGVDINQRVGNEVKILSVNLKVAVSEFGIASGVRTMLIQDTQQISDTAPSIGDMFARWAPNNYLLNIANNKRFKILERSSIVYGFQTAGNTSSFTGANPYAELNIFHKFKYPLRVRYNGTTSNDVQKNALYLVVMSGNETNASLVGQNYPCVVSALSRVKYIDG